MTETRPHEPEEATEIQPPGRNPEQVLDALQDADSRALLAATSESPHTAKELAEICDLSLSATYRRLEQLTEAGLLAEGTRVRAGRRPAAEYQRDFDGLAVTVADDGRLVVRLEATGPDASQS
ncbi:MAG: ArsR/SmtB family transcription factor [Halobacteriaceae archaeon]